MDINFSKYQSVLKYEKLIIPECVEDDVMERGAFYSTLLESWRILRSELNYPKNNKSYFKRYLTGSHYVPCTLDEERSLIFDRLSVHFNVKRNVRSIAGHNFLDFIIQPRSEAPLQPESRIWRNPDIFLGITMNDFNNEYLTNENERALRYIDLAKNKWDKYGRVPIFVKPGIYDGFNRSQEKCKAVKILMKHRVGYIDSFAAGFQFRLSNKTVWDPYYGVGDMGARSHMRT